MEIIQEIGAYAGLAAIVGLALLSALYFSQARDVRRLREWAGKAPERTSEPAAQAPKVVARPVPRAPGAVTPAAQPVPAASPAAAAARPSAVGVGATVATGPAAATPAAARVAEAPGQADTAGGGADDNGVSQDTMAHPPPAEPVEDEEDPSIDSADAGVDTEDEEEDASVDSASAPVDTDDEGAYDDDYDDYDEEDEYDEETGDRPAVGAPVAAAPVTAAPRRPVPPPPITAAGSGQSGVTTGGTILPPYERSRPGGDPWHRRVFSSPGRAVAVIAAAVLVLAAATLGGLQLAKDDEGGAGGSAERSQATQAGGTNGQGAAGGANGSQPKGQPAVDPASVTVAVLNGTTVQGLAQDVGDTVAGEGYQVGTVSNFTDQTRAESVVLFAPGAEREASDVMRRLKIGQREPIDSSSQSLAGDASVVVLVGADMSQR